MGKKIYKAVRHATIHTVNVLLTSQSVRRIPTRQGQADHYYSHDEDHDGCQDWNQHFGFEPSLHPGRKFLALVSVAGQRSDSS